MATGLRDITVRVWDTISGTAILQLPLKGHVSYVDSATSFSCGSYIIVKSSNQVISYDAAKGCRLRPGEETDDSPPRSTHIIIEDQSWIVDSVTRRTISQLPLMASMSCVATHKTSLALGTSDGRVVVIHLPVTLFASLDTRAGAGGRRFPALT
jgi:WD40 repeat protein